MDGHQCDSSAFLSGWSRYSSLYPDSAGGCYEGVQSYSPPLCSPFQVPGTLDMTVPLIRAVTDRSSWIMANIIHRHIICHLMGILPQIIYSMDNIQSCICG